MDRGWWRPDQVDLGVKWSGLVIGGDQIGCQDRYRAWGFGWRDWWFNLKAVATARGWWVVDRWHAVEDSTMVGQRKRERTREEEKRDGGRSLHGGMVDRVCTADDGQTLHSEQSLHGDPIPQVLSLSFSLRVTNVLSEAGNQFKVKWVCNWFYRVGVFILQSTEIGFQFDWIFMCIQTPLRV